MNKLLILLSIFAFAGCEKETQKYSAACINLWSMSAGTEYNMETDTETVKKMPSAFIVRCCELIDGGDEPKEQSTAEGTCMADLLLVVETGKK